jgi:Xaa-Pro dipeptidase
MVIALEPKLIFPGQGMVGIENTYVVTKASSNWGTIHEVCIVQT